MKRSLAVPSSWRAWALGVLVMVGLTVSAPAFTLVVAPARYSVLQVSFDLLGRTPAVLVSYQGAGSSADPVLHAWNGNEWVLLSMKDYREGNFLHKVPERIVLIGDDATLPARLLESSTWVSEVVRFRDLTTGALVNEFGHLLNWRPADWTWFAKRYNLTLKDESEDRRKASWYDQTGPLPDRPRILERIKEGPAPAVPAVPVVISSDAAPAVEPVAVPMAEAEPVAQPVVAIEPAAPVEPAASPDISPVLAPAAGEAPLGVAPEPPADMPTK